MMSYIISKVSQNTSGNSKYVDRADAIERFLQQKRDAKAAQRAQASNSNKETTNKEATNPQIKKKPPKKHLFMRDSINRHLLDDFVWFEVFAM